jgi:arylsulfatase A-like enzyme
MGDRNDRPNIVLVLSDEHRGQAMGHAGDVNVRTPALDRMSAQGVSFRRAYANCPVCTPSRGTIFSGRHAHCGPVPNFFAAYQAAAPSLATWLQQAGYHTSYIGKWHCGIVHDQLPPDVRREPGRYPGVPVRTPEDRRAGFEDWAAFEVVNSPFKTFVYRDSDLNPTRLPGYQTDVLTDEAIRQLRAYRRDEPLFLVLSVEPPHFPCIPPKDARAMDPDALRVDPNFARVNELFAEVFPQLDARMLREILCNYYAMVENLDANLGRLLEAIAGLPGMSNTLVVYISDHGDYVGNHGMQTCKIHHHEESLRVPAIFHWPGRLAGRGAIDGLFGLVDLQATLCGLVGLESPPWNQGHDWSATLRGERDDGPREQLIEMCGVPRWTPRFTDWRGLVNERWKYAYYDNGRQFLHDLRDDPYELDNVADEHPEVLRDCRARLLERLAQTREPFFDVIMNHGVAPRRAHYIVDFERQVTSARQLGGLEITDALPMA